VGVFRYRIHEMSPRFSRTPTMTKRARALRRRMSPIEQRLWLALRNAQLGASFRRQHPAGPYVLDLYCPRVGLAIEVDGDEHDQKRAHDAIRTRFLSDKGILVMRFSNADVRSNLEGVKLMIRREIEQLRG